jgi:hypothetical protein
MPITPMRSRSTNGRVARLAAAVPVERRVEGQRDEATQGHALGIDPRPLLLDAAIGRPDDDRGVLLGLVEILGQVDVRGDRDPEPVPVRHRLARDVLVELEDVVVGEGHLLLLSWDAQHREPPVRPTCHTL